MPRVYIKGLVKYMNTVRNYMVHGLPEAERKKAAVEINNTIQKVNKICKKYHIRPEQLPQPTYQAYLYLRNVDPNSIPVSDITIKNDKEVRIKNVISFVNSIQDELSQAAQSSVDITLLEDSMIHIRKMIQDEIYRIEESVCQQSYEINNLPSKTYKAYKWLKFLLEENNLSKHIMTLKTLYEQFALNQRKIFRNKKISDIRIYFISSLYSISSNSTSMRLSLNEGYIGVPDEVLKALCSVIFKGKNKEYVKLLRSYSETETFREINRSVNNQKGTNVISNSIGQYFDLDKIFWKVNSEYFYNQMSKPNLTWNRQLTKRKLGHYNLDTDTVMISIALDKNETPDFIIEYVMYHELLHKKLGIVKKGNKRYAHTSVFHNEEKKFKQYEKVKMYLNKNKIHK